MTGVVIACGCSARRAAELGFPWPPRPSAVPAGTAAGERPPVDPRPQPAERALPLIVSSRKLPY